MEVEINRYFIVHNHVFAMLQIRVWAGLILGAELSLGLFIVRKGGVVWALDDCDAANIYFFLNVFFLLTSYYKYV